ncbi:hypothetical protein K503DRAFT_772464 [Rhizopogon vinicolor AM-OR11-026]|uniref:Uncharacterized protein n=1 Tax=Rhizopogon vinicolor AM-OR11-026 TaxID=1314800 RepID=A0A1B7MV77_9AGAM|nr:hypothetical protein K503DRAFT_772464 [Rhizopogon vinicolor AM-OR11-026]
MQDKYIPTQMCPSATKNGRNLCAFCWLREIKTNVTTEEFDLYYSSLTPIQRTVQLRISTTPPYVH